MGKSIKLHCNNILELNCSILFWAWITTHWLRMKVQYFFWYIIFLVTASLINGKPEYKAAFIGQIRPILRYSIIRSDSALCYKLQNQLVGCYIQLAQIHCTLCYLKLQGFLIGVHIQLVTDVICYLHYGLCTMLYAICLSANFMGATFNWSQMYYAIYTMLHASLPTYWGLHSTCPQVGDKLNVDQLLNKILPQRSIVALDWV